MVFRWGEVGWVGWVPGGVVGTFIRATRCAKRHVEMLSSTLFLSADRVAIIVVMQFPPKLSRNNDVIMELRYGMWLRAFSDSATITCSK